MNTKRKKRKKYRILFTLLIIAVIVTGITYISHQQTTKWLDHKEQESQLKEINQNKKIKYEYIKKNKEEVYQGNLILVNEKNPYRFKDIPVKSVYSLKNEHYQIKDKNVALKENLIPILNTMFKDCYQETGIQNIMVFDGYRTYQTQQKILNSRLKTQGEEARKWVSKPGSSEHHTGLSLDLSVYQKGVSVDFTGKGKYQWVQNNITKYGFIIRYDKGKSNITGISNEPWHLRYVGIPHASIMEEKNLCLEEYIDFLKQYPYDKEHFNVQLKDGVTYEIYYIPQEKADKILVPSSLPYEISGNNVDGFIITVKIST